VHPTVARVVAAAAARGVEIDVHEFPDGTHTAEDAAGAVGVDVAQIVKSLAFTVDGRTVLALVSGRNRLDPAALARANGTPDAAVARADANAVRAATGFAIGGVPPFGHEQLLPTFVDRDLTGYDEVWAAAGTPYHVFPISPGDLVRLSDGFVAELAAR
jgi:prolyl-tRNA editing enzyme YbaK/EbsC (Cys-tRNA(Pro) deacylase)